MSASAQLPQQFIEDCQGLVRSLASQIHRRLPPQVELDDLVAYGQVGLAEAARDFDSSRGSRFSTYAYYRIRGAIYDGVAKMSWFSRSQRYHVRYEQGAGDLLQASAEYPLQGAADPEANMRWFRDLSRALAVAYLSSHCLPRAPDTASLADSTRFAPPAQAMRNELSHKLDELIRSLPPDEGKLIRAAYFEGLTLQEAGRRLGISKSWATRLHTRALQRLARALKLQGLAS
jgi:RNA polymerase sigma factor FliA